VIGEAASEWWALDDPATRTDLYGAPPQLVGTHRPHLPIMAALSDMASYDELVEHAVNALLRGHTDALRRHI